MLQARKKKAKMLWKQMPNTCRKWEEKPKAKNTEEGKGCNSEYNLCLGNIPDAVRSPGKITNAILKDNYKSIYMILNATNQYCHLGPRYHRQ